MQDQLAEMLPSGFRWCQDSSTLSRGDKEVSAATAGFIFAWSPSPLLLPLFSLGNSQILCPSYWCDFLPSSFHCIYNFSYTVKFTCYISSLLSVSLLLEYKLPEGKGSLSALFTDGSWTWRVGPGIEEVLSKHLRTEWWWDFEMRPGYFCHLLWIPLLCFLIILIFFSVFYRWQIISNLCRSVSSSLFFLLPPFSVSCFALSDLNWSVTSSKSFLWPHRLKQDLLAPYCTIRLS